MSAEGSYVCDLQLANSRRWLVIYTIVGASTLAGICIAYYTWQKKGESAGGWAGGGASAQARHHCRPILRCRCRSLVPWLLIGDEDSAARVSLPQNLTPPPPQLQQRTGGNIVLESETHGWALPCVSSQFLLYVSTKNECCA